MKIRISDGQKFRNLLVTIAYVGTNYHGFQIQQNAVTVQQVFQEALQKTLGALPDIKGCSRTDSGVHANEYCISLQTDSEVTEEKLCDALNYHLPKDIRAYSAREVSPDFHARYDCVKKRYRYLVCNSRVMNPFLEGRAMQFVPHIDVKRLQDTAQHFIGTHDFVPFSGNKRATEDTVRTVFSFSVEREENLVTFLVEADGFLYNMVRIMVGTLLSVSRNKLCEADIDRIFESGVRPNECFTAPAEGLYLDKVFYEFEDEE